MRVLVVRYRKLGDALMVTPVLRALHETGRYEISTVAEFATERVFTRMPGVVGNVAVSSGQPSRVEIVRAGLRARRFRPEAALVLSFKRRAAILARLAGCRERYGAGEPKWRDLGGLTRNVYDPTTWGDLHQVERYYAIAEAMAGPLPRFPTVFHLGGADSQLGPLPPNYAVVHVGNGGSNLRMTDAQYRETVRRLRAEGWPVVVSGAPDALAYEEARSAADGDFVGRTDLDALAKLFRGASVVVGADGGGPRLAAAMGTPVVTVSIGFRWSAHQAAPWMARGAVVEPEARCAGCVLHRCTKQGGACLETLRTERIVEAARALVESRPPRV